MSVITKTVTTTRIEDYILLIATTLGAFATFATNQSVTVFGLSPFILAAVAGAIGKGVSGLTDIKSYEDWILVVSTALGSLATILPSGHDPAYAVYGLVVGQIGKAVLGFQGANKTNVVEDVFLFVFSVLTAIGQAFNLPNVVDFAQLIATIGKAAPSLAGATAINNVVSAPAPAAPVAPAPAPKTAYYPTAVISQVSTGTNLIATVDTLSYKGAA